MSRTAFRTILLLLCLLLAATIFGRQADTACTGFSAPYKAFISGYPHKDTLSIEQLLQTGKLAAPLPTFEIVSFNVGAVADNAQTYYTTHCYTNRFNNDALQIIKLLQAGGKLFIDCIRAKNSKGVYFMFRPFIIIIAAAGQPPSG